VPYNVAVYYKWLPGQLDFPSDITPPDAAKVIPVLKALLNVAYAPYNQQTGSNAFLRRYLPKVLEMAGSAEYLPNGARFLGQAEGGTSMLLYEVNNFSRLKADSNTFKQTMHTMHHEFGISCTRMSSTPSPSRPSPRAIQATGIIYRMPMPASWVLLLPMPRPLPTRILWK